MVSNKLIWVMGMRGVMYGKLSTWRNPSSQIEVDGDFSHNQNDRLGSVGAIGGHCHQVCGHVGTKKSLLSCLKRC